MLNKKDFEEYKEFYELKRCPWCFFDKELPTGGDGLFACALDEKFIPLNKKKTDIYGKKNQRKVEWTAMKKLIKKALFGSSRLDSDQLDKEYTTQIEIELKKQLNLSYYAYQCEGCATCWVESVKDKSYTQKLNLGYIPAVIFYPTNSRDATAHLADKAYSFFEDEYKNSQELELLIEEYASLRVDADVSIMNGWERQKGPVKAIEKAMDRLNEFLYNSIHKSMLKQFPGRSLCIAKAEELFSTEELLQAIARLVMDRLLVEFINELSFPLWDNYKVFLRNRYPAEAMFILDDFDRRDGCYNELYGRCIKLTVTVMAALGVEMQLLESDKIIFGNFNAEGDIRTITKNFTMLNMTVIIKDS